jgi:hypothetical protein
VTDTVQTLSLPEQPLDAAYFRRVLACSPKAVIAAPCGYGKTRGVAAFIAEQWQEGVLYVAERKAQLDSMKQLLVEHQGIDPERIGVYHGDSEDVERLEQEGEQKPIALVTHARMLSDSPKEYVLFEENGYQVHRQVLICDEAVVPLQILRVPRLFVQSLLTEMGLRWQDLAQLSGEEIETRISSIQPLLTAHAKAKFSQVGIRYLSWTDTLPDFHRQGKKGADRAVRIRRHAYDLLLHQLLRGKFSAVPDEVDVLIPLAPHVSWFAMVPQILVLDATAHLTPYLYDGYTIVRPGRWNYHDIALMQRLYLGIGNQSKTALSKYKAFFLEQVERWLPSVLQHPGFGNPHVVTYKHLVNDHEVLPEILTSMFGIKVHNYGATRGSNQFLDTNSAILLGGFRTPVEFNTLASQLYETYAPDQHAVAHWIQELYRTRIRQRNGEKIHLAVLGESSLIELLEKEIGTLSPLLYTSSPWNIDGYERFLQGQKKQTQRKLLEELRTNKRIHLRSFANQYTARAIDKVWRALKTLLQKFPELKLHIKGQEGEEYIYYVEDLHSL